MAKAQKEAIKKELIARATGKGKEPTWQEMPTQLQLVKALNYYSSEAVKVEKLQDYAKDWAKKFSPSHVDVIGKQPAWKFQTVGALMRLVSRGLALPKTYIDQINDFVNGLEMPEEVVKTKPAKRKNTMSNAENANYRQFCDALDGAVEAKSFKEPNFEVIKGHDTAPVIEACERELASMKDDPSIYPEHMKKWFRAVIKNMSAGTAAANAPVKEIKKQAKPAASPEAANDENAEVTTKKTAAPKKTADKAAAKAPTKTKAVAKPAAAEAAKPKHVAQMETQPSPDESSHILDGKKVAYLYDTRYLRLIKMVSDSKSGFKVKSKTIQNICHTNSKVTQLKGVKNEYKDGTMKSDLEGWMKKCTKKGRPFPVRGRISDALVILDAA